MVMLVSLQQASDHLRRDGTADNEDLTLKIHAASNVVINYLKDNATFLDSSDEVDVDSSGDPLGVPYEVQAAVLIVLAVLYRDREGESEGKLWEGSSLPNAAKALLMHWRRPTVA